MRTQIACAAGFRASAQSRARAHMSKDIVHNLLERLSGAGHRGGAFGSEVLLAVSRVLPKGDITSLETGCGKSTIMFSNLSKRHFVFAYDDRNMPESSVGMVQLDKDFRPGVVEFVYGPTQKTLPTYAFPAGTMFDVILLDGPHGYPFPDLEYALLYPLLKQGGILIVDDVHIPSIGHMFDTLREDRMYDEIGVFATTGVLRRTFADGVPADGDHWYEQGYNYSRFPLPMEKYHPDRSYVFGQTADFVDASTVRKHAVRGVELSADNSGVRTVDMSSTFTFKLPKTMKSTIKVALDYRFAYADAAVDTEIMIDATRHPIPATTNRSVACFEFPAPPQAEMTISLLLPNAVPEHDRGTRRYDFRRVGMDIFSMNITASGAKITTSGPALLMARLSTAFGKR